MADQVLATKFTADVTDALAGIGKLREAIQSLFPSAKTFQDNMAGVSSAIKTLTTSIDASVSSLSKISDEMKKVSDANQNVTKELTEAEKAQKEMNEAQKEGKRRGELYAEASKLVKEQLKGNKVAIEGALSELRKLDDEFHKLTVKGTAGDFKEFSSSANMASVAIDKYANSAKLGAIPVEAIRRANKNLGIDLTDAVFKTTALGKVFVSTAEKGQVFFNALTDGLTNYDATSQESVKFAKSLKSVHDHLSSIPPSMHSYGQAQDALKDSTTLTTLANHVLDGSIKAIDGGYKNLSNGVINTKTVLSDFGVTLTKLTNQSENYVGAVTKFSETQKKSGEHWDNITKRANEFSKASSEVASMQSVLIDKMEASGKSFVDSNGKILTATELSKRLSNEKDVLNKRLSDQGTVYQALTKEIDANTNGVMKHLIANHSDLLSVQELGKEYYGLNKAVRQLSDYVPAYTDALKKRTEGHETNRAAIEYNAEAITKYAKTAESLITQNRNIADSLIEAAKGSDQYKNNQQGLIEYTQKINDETKKFENTLRDQETVLNSTASANKNTANAILNYATEQGVAKEVTDRVRNGIYELLPPMKGYEEQIKKLNTSIANQSKTNIEAREELDKLVKAREIEVQKAKEVAESQKALQKAYKDQIPLMDQVVIKIKELAMYYASAALLYGLTQAIRTAALAVADFDQSLASLRAITNATSVEIFALGHVMRNVAKESRYSTKEIADGLEIMGQAGLDAVQSINTIEAAVNLATGTLEKMEPVVDLLTSTMIAFNMSSLESTRIADVMAVAINESKLSVEKLRTAFNYVGLTASQMGLSVEETAASLMVMADAGMRASTMGTALRQVLSRLVAPSQKLREAYSAAGVSLDKINPLTSSYKDSLEALTSVLWDNERGVVNTSKAYSLFGQRGANAAIAIVRAFKQGDYQQALDSLYDSGEAARMAGDQMEGIVAKFDNLISRLKELAITIGEAGISNLISETMSVLSLLISQTRDLIAVPLPSYMSTLTNSLTAFVGGLTLATIAVKAWNYAMGLSVTMSTGFIASLKTIQASIAAMNPVIYFSIAIISSLILVYNNYRNSLKNSILALGEEAIQLKGNSDLYKILNENLKKTQKDEVAFVSHLKRFSLEHKDLTEVLLKEANATDLNSLSYKELSAVLTKLELKTAQQSFEKMTDSLKSQKYWINLLSTEHKLLNGITFGWIDHTRQLKIENDSYEKTLKSLASQLYETGISMGYSEEETIAMAKALNLTADGFQIVSDKISEFVTRKKQQDLAIKASGKEMLEGLEEMYESLTVSQRSELTKMSVQLNEELAQYEKWANEHTDIVEDKEAIKSAIVLKYSMKSLEAISEFQKGSIESQLETFNREQELLNKKIGLVENYLKKAHDDLAAAKAQDEKLHEGSNQKEIDALKDKYATARNQVEIGEEQLAKLIMEKQRTLSKEKIETLDLYYDALKQRSSAEFNSSVQTEQAKLENKVRVSKLEVEQAEKVSTEIIAVYGKTSAEAIKAMNSELSAREQNIQDQLTLIESLSGKIEESYDGAIKAVEEKSQLETGIIRDNLETRLSLLDIEQSRELTLLENSTKSLANIERGKTEIHNKYFNEVQALRQKAFQDTMAVSEQEYQDTLSLLGKKYSERITYEGNVVTAAKSTKQATDELFLAETNMTREELKSRGISWAEYRDKRKALFSDDFIKNNLVAETQFTKEELDKQGVKWVEYQGKVYSVVEGIKKEVETKNTEQSTSAKKLDDAKRELDEKYLARKKAIIAELLQDAVSALTQEEQRYEALVNKKKSLDDSLKGLEFQRLEDERSYRQTSMSDAQKYYDDLKERDRLYSEFLKINDVSYLEEAKKLNDSLVGDHKGTNGEIEVALKTSADAKYAFDKQYYDDKVKLIKDEKKAVEDSIKDVEEKIKGLKAEITSYGVEIQKITAQEITIKEEKAKASLEALNKTVADLKKALEDLSLIQIELKTDLLDQQLAVAKKAVEDAKVVMEANPPKIQAEVVGKERTLEEELNKAKEEIKKLKEHIDSNPVNLIIESKIKTEKETVSFETGMNNIQNSMTAFNDHVKANPVDYTVNAKAYEGESKEAQAPTALLDLIKEKADALQSEDFTYNIFVNGLDQLIKAVEYQNQLKDTSVTHTITTVLKTVTESSGGSSGGSYATPEGGSDIYHLGGIVNKIRKFAAGGFSGLLSGYGGGDIIPAWLEPGEFVLRKEAVKKRGLRLAEMFNNLNLSTSDMMSNLFSKSFNFGGAVLPGSKTSSYYPPQQTVNQGSTQTYTVEFKVGNDSYQLKGEGNVVQRMVANMRRSRLVTV
ncbi:MAG: phage tail tape measure protein [Sulfuricurvum sp.]|nr:phage tail tape measure protein [Sulfuricurvum sp.]